MRFLGWLFVVLVFTFTIGFFADWFDVSKHDGVVSFHVNSHHIGSDCKSAAEFLRHSFKESK